jgi:hypothetical protein
MAEVQGPGLLPRGFFLTARQHWGPLAHIPGDLGGCHTAVADLPRRSHNVTLASWDSASRLLGVTQVQGKGSASAWTEGYAAIRTTVSFLAASSPGI